MSSHLHAPVTEAHHSLRSPTICRLQCTEREDRTLLYTPLQEADVDHLSDEEGLSVWDATISMVKGIVGAGTFALPWAFMNSGIIAGIASIILLAWLSSHTITLLVSLKHYTFPSLSTARGITYFDIGHVILGRTAALCIQMSVLCCSLGVSTAYIDFVRCLCMSLLPTINEWSILLTVFPCIVILALLRSYKMISFVAVLGDVAIIAGACVVLLYGIFVQGVLPWQDIVSDNGLWIRWNTFPAFLSTAAFLFCVHFFVLPIEQSMSRPHQFNSAVHRSFVMTVLLNCAFGVIGYACFGTHTNAIVIQNVTGGIWITATKVLLCFDMIFSYAVVFAPGRELVEKSILLSGKQGYPNTKARASPKDDSNGNNHTFSIVMPSNNTAHHRSSRTSSPATTYGSLPITSSSSSPYSSVLSSPLPSLWNCCSRAWFSRLLLYWFGVQGTRNVIRIFLVCVTFFFCICIPFFSVVISLVGGISMVSLAFVFPPLMALQVMKEVEGASKKTDVNDDVVKNGVERTNGSTHYPDMEGQPLVSSTIALRPSSVTSYNSLLVFSHPIVTRCYYYSVILLGASIMLLTIVAQGMKVYEAVWLGQVEVNQC